MLHISYMNTLCPIFLTLRDFTTLI